MDSFNNPFVNKKISFESALTEVQNYLSTKYGKLLSSDKSSDQKEQIKAYILKYIQDNGIVVENICTGDLIERLYSEMAEFSFLTKYIFFKSDIEEININSWDDIEIIENNGNRYKLDEHFTSPQHALDIVRKLLRVSGTIIDDAQPFALGSLSSNIRISAMKSPLVDEDIGVVCAIRIVNAVNFHKSNLIDKNTATEEMLDFLSLCIRYGVSIVVAGATGSGKTTTANWIMTTIPDDKRICTIESGSREFNLRKVDANGNILNSVIHTMTRFSENEKANVDQVDLLALLLRFHPDIIGIGEVRGKEAYTAQEAARTGHTVITTVHANSCDGAYRRFCSLIKQDYEIKDETIYEYVTEAFPIVIFQKQLEDSSRKITEILECEIDSDGLRRFRPLWQYITEENTVVNNKVNIKGRFEKVNTISKGLKKRFIENGLAINILKDM